VLGSVIIDSGRIVGIRNYTLVEGEGIVESPELVDRGGDINS